jgi:GNAT superfamily N-acetyltransferase
MAARVSIRVRPANRQDVPAIADLLHHVGWFAHINREPQLATEARITSQLAMNNDYGDHTVLIAELVTARGASHLAAYLNVHWLTNLIKGADGYISELFVREEDRGKGTGNALLDAVRREASKRGCTRLLLFNLKQRESYQRGFYVKQGFEERTDGAFFTQTLIES